MNGKASIGLLGVGLLGSALAERLLKHGFPVVGFDIDHRRLEHLELAGGRAGGDASSVFAECQTVFLSLPTSDTACELLARQETSLLSGRTIIDTTTGNPEQVTELAGALRQQGIDYIEATVAGSSTQVRAGRALLFLGGAIDHMRHVQPLLTAIADQQFHLGPVGAASRFKLVHNLLLGLHRAVLAEGLTFAEALGFDAAEALEILRQTPAASAVMETKGRKMVAANYEPQARLAQHRKDVLLILAEARRVGLRTPLSDLHADLLDRAEQLGYGDADNSAIIEAFRQPR